MSAPTNNAGLESFGRKIDTVQAAATFDRREDRCRLTHAMLAEDDPCGLRYLEETSLSRVWQHANDPHTPFGILTAFRLGEPGHETEQAKINAHANRALAGDVRAAGFGYFFLRGNYVLKSGIPVQEISLLIPGRPGETDKLRETLQHLIVKYRQESALFKPEGGDEAFFLFADGRLESVGRFHPDKVDAYMSELTMGAGRGGTFVFEAIAYTHVHHGMFGSQGSQLRWAKKIGAPGPL